MNIYSVTLPFSGQITFHEVEAENEEEAITSAEELLKSTMEVDDEFVHYYIDTPEVEKAEE